jgi:hypothetical protein
MTFGIKLLGFLELVFIVALGCEEIRDRWWPRRRK